MFFLFNFKITYVVFSFTKFNIFKLVINYNDLNAFTFIVYFNIFWNMLVIYLLNNVYMNFEWSYYTLYI